MLLTYPIQLKMFYIIFAIFNLLVCQFLSVLKRLCHLNGFYLYGVQESHLMSPHTQQHQKSACFHMQGLLITNKDGQNESSG